MSRIVVDLKKVEKQESSFTAPDKDHSRVSPVRRGAGRTVLRIFLGLFLLVLLAGGIGGYIYWQELKRSPAYSLALVVDAARKDDKEALARLVDTDRIVDAFVPQITDKAVELYGRGLPPGIIQKLARVAAPVLPAVKDRARAELPRLIREKTKSAENVPFFMLALGASQSLEIRQEGEVAWVKSNAPDRPLELKMQKKGDTWQIVEVKDEALARKIAEQMGQEIIAAANNGVNRAGEIIGVRNLNEVIRMAEEFLR